MLRRPKDPTVNRTPHFAPAALIVTCCGEPGGTPLRAPDREQGSETPNGTFKTAARPVSGGARRSISIHDESLPAQD
jgi:hypothetical protein